MSGNPTPICCWDTSVFINGWRRHYPPDIFGPLWDRLATLAKTQEIVAPIVVLDELEDKDDEITQWARQNREMFIPLEEDIQIAVGQIQAQYETWINPNSTRNRADPFVVAVGLARSLPVVTYEDAPTPDQRKPNIPLVCNHFGVDWWTLADFMRRQSWTFTFA